jgi:hypothetical protein
MQYY